MTIRHYTGFSLKDAMTTAVCVLTVTLGVSACSDSDTGQSEPTQEAAQSAGTEPDLSLDAVFENLNDQLDKASDQVQGVVGPHAEQIQSRTKDEVKKLFKWEYKVLDLAANITAAEMESQLSELGDHGWECSSVLPVATGLRITCKRKPPSTLAYLKYIPGL